MVQWSVVWMHRHQSVAYVVPHTFGVGAPTIQWLGWWMLIHGPFVVFIPHGYGLSVGWSDWSSGRVSWVFFDHMHHLICVSMCCSVEYIHGPGFTDTIQWWWGGCTPPPHRSHLPPPRKGSEIMLIGICIGVFTSTQFV